ncbi:type VI secretion system baseplate subunit TssE [Pseudomonas alabamensis]|uniref:type VI secretion system baseplate subunit TssE n=1 Tax=Pseudomonas alabamensis TaxID=3064349 RepID=UPI003F65264A
MVVDIAPRDRLQPSLLDRLTDDDPSNRQEAPDKRVLSLQQLKASVLRDLTWLLNTTSLLDETAALESPAGASVLNYGLPALAGVSASSIDLEMLERVLHQTIIAYEPRILAHTLKVRACVAHAQTSGNALSFEIEGDLWAQPAALPLLLHTDVDLESGHVRVAPADRRRRT